MSIHARPTSAARARLRAQRRNSKVASAVISVVVFGAICRILAHFFPDPPDDRAMVIVTYQPPRETAREQQSKKIKAGIGQRPSAPSSSAARMIAAEAVSPVAVPVPAIELPDPSTDPGLGDSTGEEWGWELPESLRERCSHEQRVARLAANGGDSRCEEAVVQGLRRLKSTQNADGSWTGSEQCAMTGLALLAYLGHCETPASPEFGESCLKAITYLVDRGLKNGGMLASSGQHSIRPYEHAIATYALGEATIFCRQFGIEVPELAEVTRLAGQLIIDNQHRSGGWDYGYMNEGHTGGDLSITAWQLQALKACRDTGADHPGLAECAKRALDYVETRQRPDGGFIYAHHRERESQPQDPANGYCTLTGAGMVCLQLWGRGSSSAVSKAARYLCNHSRFGYVTADCDLYGTYYASQAMAFRGGKQGSIYLRMVRNSLLAHQRSDGTWPPPGAGGRIHAMVPESTQNEHYRGCLCILMLEVDYRYLPATGGIE